MKTTTGTGTLPPPTRRGKVRDLYDVGERLLLVASDRVSAFDVILPQQIPDKGRLLTGLSAFWFAQTQAVVPNHLVSVDLRAFPPPYRDAEELRGRTMLVRKAERIDVECVVRGYLAGSAWKEYRESGRVAEHALPKGLSKGAKLPEPLFTPTTKEDEGHDRPITFAEMQDLVGGDLAQRLRRLSIDVFSLGHRIAEARGFLVADTKFEFGRIDGQLHLIDEALTPDSSRYWRKSQYREGEPPESWDKQVIRDYLESLDWDKQPPAPDLPATIVARARERYLDVYRAITGVDLEP
ncbi:MAG: phosphoribosylaminoimidazolesuccinocarboxamide synthase [bacterium]